VLFLLARYDQAEPVARELLAHTGDRERRARMAWTLAYTLLRTRRAAEALDLVGQALRDGGVPEVWRARLRSVRAVVLASDAQSDAQHHAADLAAAEALADADRAGDRFAAGYALHVRSVVHFFDGDDPGCLAITERALEVIGDDPETADLQLLLLRNRLSSLTNLARDADAEARQLLALAEQAGTARISDARSTVAEYLFESGRWDDALVEALFEPGADVLNWEVVVGRGLAALIAAHRDDRAEVAAHLDAAEKLLPGLHGRRRIYSVYLLRAKAVAAERDGRPGEAMAFLAAAVATPGLDVAGELYWLADLVRCALAAGDRPAAEAAAARCEDEAARRGGPSLAAARWCRGLADADPGPLAEAVAYYRTVTWPLALGGVLEDLAVVRAASGDAGEARAALREAVALYAGLGAEWDILRADTRVRPYGVRRRRAGTRRPETGWEALTPTEAKIAGLVGEGLSNPDIAARLFLSRNTVQCHMSKILAKLQVRSRVEVATVVARRPADARAASAPPAAHSTA
jgi:DNA-binding CsgD family transcriptional regulator